MRSKHVFILLCGIVLLALGCAENEQPNGVSPTVPYDEVVTTEKRVEDMLAGMTLEERGRRYFEHLKAYLQLLEKNPDAAYAELEKAAIFVWRGHPLYKDWAQLVFRLDRAGKASLSALVHRAELELQMAKDRPSYKEQVADQEAQLEFWQREKETAEAAGQNPAHVFVEFVTELVED